MPSIFTRIPKLIWKRLPWIALYTLTLYVILSVGTALFYRLLPGNFFLSYSSANAQNIQEGQPLPFKVCRTMRFGSHEVRGSRLFYKVSSPDNVSETSQTSKDNAVLLGQYELGGQLSTDTCVDLFVRTEQFNHEAGYYFFRTIFNFDVGGNRKQVRYDSNVYVVTGKNLTPEEIQLRIIELEKEIQQLKAQLLTMQSGTPVSTPAPREAPAPPVEELTTSEPPPPLQPDVAQGPASSGIISDVTDLVQGLGRGIMNVVNGVL